MTAVQGRFDVVYRGFYVVLCVAYVTYMYFIHKYDQIRNGFRIVSYGYWDHIGCLFIGIMMVSMLFF